MHCIHLTKGEKIYALINLINNLIVFSTSRSFALIGIALQTYTLKKNIDTARVDELLARLISEVCLEGHVAAVQL